MRDYRIIAGIILAVSLLPCRQILATGAPARNNQTRLEREIEALTAIDDFGLTDDQLKLIQPMCKESNDKAPVTTAPAASNEYRGALRSLREALVHGDEDKISDIQDKVDKLRESEHIDPDLDFPITDAGKSKAPTVLAMLSTAQVANYIAAHADDVPGAAETIFDALDQSRGKTDADFSSLRDEAASQVALLVGGIDPDAQKPIAQKVADLLEQSRKLTDADFKTKRGDLESQAKQIVGALDPVLGLRHWLLRDIADLLSNPGAGGAIKDKLAAKH